MEIFAAPNPAPSLEEVIGEVTRRIMNQIYGGEKNFPPPTKERKTDSRPSPGAQERPPSEEEGSVGGAQTTEEGKEEGEKEGGGEATPRRVSPSPSTPKGEHRRKGRPGDQIYGQGGWPLHTRSLPPPPPPAPQRETTQWSRVVGRRERKEKRQTGPNPATAAFMAAGASAKATPGDHVQRKNQKRSKDAPGSPPQPNLRSRSGRRRCRSRARWASGPTPCGSPGRA